MLVTSYSDADLEARVRHAYSIRGVNVRGAEGAASSQAVAAAMPEVKEPLFVAAFDKGLDATLYNGGAARARRHGKARVTDGALDLRQGGYVTFDHRGDFDLGRPITVECWVHVTRKGAMPVVVCCGHWQQAGWFLQRIGDGWRWHVGGIDCDGGKPAIGRWTHLVCSYDGQRARLFQDGRLVAEMGGQAVRTAWGGRLYVGQYGAPGPGFQVTGWVSGVKVYSRCLPAKDVAKAFGDKPKPRGK